MGIPTRNPEFFAPAAIGIEPSSSAVLMSPDSDYGPSHEWLLERWLEIAHKLLRNGCRVTVAGVDGGRGLGKRLAANLGSHCEKRR